MDFMKVFDQAVREIKREVNLKVLKAPEIEQKVLDATDDEPWGPHGTVLAEIAQATKKYTHCQMVMNILWTRLNETGKNWRLVYKALTVIEYLVAHGSERAVDDIIEHNYQISCLISFEYVEPSGKDVGINVRKKAETIVTLLHSQDKIQEARNKAAANRDKYIGVSSSGVTYKSSAASFNSCSFRNSDKYGGFGNKGDRETFGGSYKDRDRYGEEKYRRATSSKKEPSYNTSKEQVPAAMSALKKSSETSKSDAYASVLSKDAPSNNYDEDFDDFDDFDPRAPSKPHTDSKQVDLFGGNLVDLMETPASHPTANSTYVNKDQAEVDLFADANFEWETPQPKAVENCLPQNNVDLFASQPVPAVSATVDFFAALDPVPQTDNKASTPDTTTTTVDPFAAFPLNNFDASDPFSAFSTQTNPLSTASNKSLNDESHDPFGAFTSHTDTFTTPFDRGPGDGSTGNMDGSPVGTKTPGNADESMGETKTASKKEGFQVNSGVWADSLSRGLIDLNITAPKKANLADGSIVGGQEKNIGQMPSVYRGSAMYNGTGPGKSGLTSSATPASIDDDLFSSLGGSQYQFGSFQK